MGLSLSNVTCCFSFECRPARGGSVPYCIDMIADRSVKFQDFAYKMI